MADDVRIYEDEKIFVSVSGGSDGENIITIAYKKNTPMSLIISPAGTGFILASPKGHFGRMDNEDGMEMVAVIHQD